MPEAAGPLAFLLLVLLTIVGILVALFFGVGALTGVLMPAGAPKAESWRAMYLRRSVGALDVVIAVASIAVLLFYGIVATLALVLGAIKPALIVVPLLGAAVTGGMFVAAALAQFLRKRRRWVVQLAAVVAVVIVMLTYALAERLLL